MAGLAHGFSGFGAALIFVPLASSVVGPKFAAPILLMIDNVSALGLLPNAWRRADKAVRANIILFFAAASVVTTTSYFFEGLFP